MGKAKLSILATAVVLGLTGCGGGSSSSVDRDDSTNRAPVANAGSAQTVETGTEVTLSGASSSDADGDSLTYLWALTTLPAGSDATLSSTSAASPTFTPDVDGEYVAQLVVNDGLTSSSAVTVTITAESANGEPVANAGADQNVSTTSLVTLNGADSSDPEGDALTYSWSVTSQPQGSDISLSSSTAVSPTFTPEVDGEYNFSLTVNDGQAESQPDDVRVVASSVNSAPIAEAGPTQNVPADQVVTLDGSGSTDADGDELTYSWTFGAVPDGSTAELTGADTSMPSFTPTVEGSYTVSLMVNDGTIGSEPDTVTINVTRGNSAPVANAGDDQRVIVGDSVQLMNMSTDADEDLLTYEWAFVSVPEGSSAALSDPTAESPSFTADVEGNYVVSLVANDGTVDSEADNVLVEAVPPGVRFFRKSGSSNNYAEFSLSFITAGNFSREVTQDPLPESVVLYTYKLQAEGQDFTISNLYATGTNGITPFFSGLADGQVLEEGEEVIFTINSPLTNGQPTSLRFHFEIEETGEQYDGQYQFSTTTP